MREAEGLRGLPVRAGRRDVLPHPELRGDPAQAGHERVGWTGKCVRAQRSFAYLLALRAGLTMKELGHMQTTAATW